MGRAPMIIGGAVVYAAGVVAAMMWKQKPSDKPPISNSERRKVFDSIAPGYDSDVGLHERLSGISSLRKKLVEHTEGRTLEVGAGTGRNTELYVKHAIAMAKEAARSGSGGGGQTTGVSIAQAHKPLYAVTLLDFSEGMLSLAKAKHASLAAQAAGVLELEYRVGNATAISLGDGTAALEPDGSYDCAVSTFTLCSFDDPVAVLKELRRVVRPGGSILLLEHGAASPSFAWLTRFLDNSATEHSHKYGCNWNRDILGLVQAAGLTVESVQRKHLGTTYFLRCKA